MGGYTEGIGDFTGVGSDTESFSKKMGQYNIRPKPQSSGMEFGRTVGPKQMTCPLTTSNLRRRLAPTSRLPTVVLQGCGDS